MNRLLMRSFAVALAVLFVAGIAADAATKPKKKKKAYDLNANPLAEVKSKQPDKELYDKAMAAMKKGRYDVARLDLQVLLNTYPESEYRMRAKLSVGDTWYKEGGSAAYMQAEAEYKDFITFFPDAPEAAEAQMKVADIYYQQMEKPDRDFTNVQQAEEQYRNMINMFPDSTLVPRAKQKLRDVQEVMAEREAEIGFFYESRENINAAIARLETVSDTYPLYSKSDQVLIGIGDAYALEAHNISITTRMPAAVRERLVAVYQDKAAQAYDKVITRYPMYPHVEDARDRLVGMNRPIPEATEAALAESDAEVRSHEALHFTDSLLGIIKHGPTMVEATHVGDPTLTDPHRVLAPDITKQNVTLFGEAMNGGNAQPAVAAPATGVNEPPRSDQPSQAPLQMEAPPAGGTGVGAEIVSSPNATGPAAPEGTGNGGAAVDPNAVLKPVGPVSTALPAVETPSTAPNQINDVKPGEAPQPTAADANKKKPKADLSDESSSKKKKKKGLAKIF
jgi:outer membrane protein assembly factor BamD